MSAEAQSTPATVKLQSSDNQVLTVEKDVAERSILIKNMIDDVGDEAITEAIPIPNVNFLHILKHVHSSQSLVG